MEKCIENLKQLKYKQSERCPEKVQLSFDAPLFGGISYSSTHGSG